MCQERNQSNSWGEVAAMQPCIVSVQESIDSGSGNETHVRDRSLELTQHASDTMLACLSKKTRRRCRPAQHECTRKETPLKGSAHIQIWHNRLVPCWKRAHVQPLLPSKSTMLRHQDYRFVADTRRPNKWYCCSSFSCIWWPVSARRQAMHQPALCSGRCLLTREDRNNQPQCVRGKHE